MENIRQMYRKARRICDEVIDHPFGSVWNFEDDARLDQLAHNFRTLDLSYGFIERYLRMHGIDKDFRSLYQNGCDGVIDRAVVGAIHLKGYPQNRIYSPEEKREYVAEQILQYLRQKDNVPKQTRLSPKRIKRKKTHRVPVRRINNGIVLYSRPVDH